MLSRSFLISGSGCGLGWGTGPRMGCCAIPEEKKNNILQKEPANHDEHTTGWNTTGRLCITTLSNRAKGLRKQHTQTTQTRRAHDCALACARPRVTSAATQVAPTAPHSSQRLVRNEQPSNDSQPLGRFNCGVKPRR